MWPRRAVRADDAFGQKVRNRIPARRNIGAVEVIEALVLADNDDDVLYRADCRRTIRCVTRIGAGGGSGNPHAEQGNGNCDKGAAIPPRLAVGDSRWHGSLPFVLIQPIFPAFPGGCEATIVSLGVLGNGKSRSVRG